MDITESQKISKIANHSLLKTPSGTYKHCNRILTHRGNTQESGQGTTGFNHVDHHVIVSTDPALQAPLPAVGGGLPPQHVISTAL